MCAMTLSSAQTAVGSIRVENDRRRAASLLKEGYAVGSFTRAVCGIWVDAANEDAINEIYRIKGSQRVGRPMSTVLPAADFVELIDPHEVPAALGHAILDAGELQARFGSLGFIRAPIRQDAAEAMPAATVSRSSDGKYWLQNYVTTPSGIVRSFVQEMLEQGVVVPAATSMNISGQPEIVDQQEGAAFCESRGIPLFLADPDNDGRVRGSFPIVSFDRTGVRLLREGQFPGYLVRHLLGCEVDSSNTSPAGYPVVRTHSETRAAWIPPHQLHDEIVARLDGH
jgi:tRNA A37 threonylcarbamoyladenosine synthetase subunit TsaC/SUA5/YrdC